ncbi:MAG: hypothetical protein HKN50_00685 [Gammaproteobacteria bacterium]|nr:hypothetical protein [Gammaproteobacteria bacterium]
MNQAVTMSPSETGRVIDLSSYARFTSTFPLQGEHLYARLFDAHQDIVQTRKQKVAVANLARIFDATFAISAASGFDKMSLRDLSRQADMSMGAIYSCISRKEDIVLMVADIVRQSSELTRQFSLQAASCRAQLEQGLRFHLYASTLLQPWYFFLFFETRSLSDAQQQASKQIELDAIGWFEAQIEEGIASGEFKPLDASMLANTLVVLLEDWYLKPWKYQAGSSRSGSAKQALKQKEKNINAYYASLTAQMARLLAVE